MWGLTKKISKHFMIKVFADYQENHKEFDKKENFSIERVGGIKFLRKIRKAQLVNEFLKENKVQGVIADHWKSLELINTDKKKYCLIHGKEINHPKGSSLNKRAIKVLNNAEKVIANSEYTKNLAVNNGVNKEKIKVINPGSNYPMELKKEYIEKARKIFKDAYPKIITIARLDKRKNHQNILMCIKNLKIKFPKIKYISIGDGEEKRNLKSLQEELGLRDEVTFLYKTNNDIKNSLLNNSDLFLMPSIIHNKSVEGFGITFIEAASYKKGSIGGNCGGERDAIEDGKTGYICDGNDLNSIYETVLKFFNNDNYKTLGNNAHEFSKNFKWNIIIKKYLELI